MGFHYKHTAFCSLEISDIFPTFDLCEDSSEQVVATSVVPGLAHNFGGYITNFPPEAGTVRKS